MSSRVAEEKKWVDEQIDHWKESMQDRRRRLHDAKMSGANGNGGGGEVVTDIVDGADNDAYEGSGEMGGGGGGRRTVHQRRSVQRRLWGKDGGYNNNDSKDDNDDDDSEGERIFGK